MDVRFVGLELAGHAAVAHKGLVQDECVDAMWICGREEQADRSAFGNAEQRGVVAPDGVHDSAYVVHPLLEAGCTGDPIG